jgi:hypothetical protein
MKWGLIGVTLCALACSPSNAQIARAAIAKQCHVDLLQPAERVLAQVDDQQPWRIYKQLGDVPELSLGSGISAEMWEGNKGSFLIRIVEPGEDISSYTEYCFNNVGRLDYLAFELRTAWGWAFRMEGSVRNGTIHTESTGFFSTKTAKPIPRPEEADDVHEALEPKVYLEAKKLPFFGLLPK